MALEWGTLAIEPNQIGSMKSPDPRMETYETSNTATEKLPYEYFNRFSLCVLDVVRKLQQISMFDKGVEKCHIIEYLRKQPYIDGDLASQVTTALRQLENCGYLMHTKNGYRTIGPFAKLCLSKTKKERLLAWRKLELKFRHCSSDSTRMLHSVSGSESDLCNNEMCSTVNTQDVEGSRIE